MALVGPGLGVEDDDTAVAVPVRHIDLPGFFVHGDVGREAEPRRIGASPRLVPAADLENGALLLVFGALIGVWVVLRPRLPWFQILNLVLIVVYVPLAVPAEILPK